MARAVRPTWGGHPYAPGLTTWASPGGRTYVLCASCDRAANHPMHHAAAIPGPRPPGLRPMGAGHGPATRRMARKVRPAPARPLDPALAALVAILDVVRAAELLSMAALVHAVALRAILTEANGHRTTPQEEVRAAGGGAASRPDRLAVGVTHHADVDATVARARNATKGIRNDRMRALATRAVAQGWTARKDGNGHLRLEREGHGTLTLSMTATGEARSWANLRAAARRKGLDVTGL